METVKPKSENLQIKNKIERKIFDGNVSVLFLGKDEELGSEGWSLRNLNSQEDFHSPSKKNVLDFLKFFAKTNNIKIFKAPIAYPKHNGILKTDESWREIYNLEDSVTVFKGENFEGCEVKVNEAFIFSPADCMTLVATDESGKVFAAHAGRDSIFDIDNMSRPNIIENIIHCFGDSVDISKIKIWAGFGIGVGKHFDHPEDDGEHKNKNVARRKYLQENFGENCYKNINGKWYIDLAQILKNMSLKAGVAPDDFQYDDSFTTEDISKAYSYRQGDKLGRNLVIISKKN